MPFQGFQVSLDGAAEMRAALKELSVEAQRDAVEEAARAGGEEMFPRVRERVPVDTGLGRDDLQLRVKQVRPGVATAPITPGKRGWYLKFFEYGTSKMPARPIFGPAFDAHGATAAGRMISVFEKMLERVVGRGH